MQRHRLASKYLLRMPDEEITMKSHDPTYLRTHGRVESSPNSHDCRVSIVEYLSILVAPLLIILYRHGPLVIREVDSITLMVHWTCNS